MEKDRPKDPQGIPSEPLILCKNLSLGYDGHIVLRDFDLRICAGDYCCVIGENGCGKTTLVRGLLGLISPIRGTIAFGAKIRRTEIGYLSQQEAAKQDFPAGVYEIVLSGGIGAMGLRPFYSRGEKQKAEAALMRLGMAGFRNRCFRELSGGQKRRVLIARALCAAKKLLVLDEPSAGLDPLAREEVYRLLKDVNRETGMTIVMISHDIAAVEKYATVVVTLGKEINAVGVGGEKK
jgi:zinc transport system ATP-binding protein